MSDVKLCLSNAQYEHFHEVMVYINTIIHKKKMYKKSNFCFGEMSNKYRPKSEKSKFLC